MIEFWLNTKFFQQVLSLLPVDTTCLFDGTPPTVYVIKQFVKKRKSLKKRLSNCVSYNNIWESEYIDVLKEDLIAEQLKHFSIKYRGFISSSTQGGLFIYCGVNKEYDPTKETENINRHEWMQYKNGF